jgi:hypothetical protein
MGAARDVDASPVAASLKGGDSTRFCEAQGTAHQKNANMDLIHRNALQ